MPPHATAPEPHAAARHRGSRSLLRGERERLDRNERRVLVLAPTQNDAALAAAFLERAGMTVDTCPDMPDLCRKLGDGCGVIFIAEEALGKGTVNHLSDALHAQPSWSDVPIVLVTGASDPAQVRLRRLHALGPTGNITVIERPFHPATLISNIEVALGSRWRQYQVRDLLEESLERERRLEFVLQAGKLGAWQLDWETERFSASGVARQNLGLGTTAEVSLAEVVEAIQPADRDAFRAAIAKTVRTGSDFRTEFRLTDGRGKARWIDMRGRIVTDPPPGITRLSGVTQDITEEKRNEQALRASEERFRRMSDSAPVMIWVSGLDKGAHWFNKAWLEFAGRPLDRELGHGWAENIHPDDAAEFLKRYAASFEARERFQLEYRYRRYDGRWRWLLDHGIPLYGPGDEFEGFIGSRIDITERRETMAELEKLVNERTATLQQTIGDLEAFSYTVSHDLRAPLRAIQSYAVILQTDYREKRLDREGLDFLDRIAKAGGRMDDLIQDVLAYSRVSRRDFALRSVRLAPFVDETLRQYPQFGGHDITVDLAENLTVQGSEPLLTQCISNLVGNAIKFARPGEPPRIAIRAEQVGPRLRLWVEDNGIGIPPDHHDRVFGMFERLDPANYEGTGVGLAIVRKAVERMGGAIGLKSEPGQGTKFWIELNTR